jgi:HAD superfamily hydrolase (TIGR01484 family)
MTDIELVVTDLDGTLWDAGERIHERSLDAMRTLQARGTPLLVATGRRPRCAARGLAREGLTPPTVALDGAIGHDWVAGHRFHRAPFSPEAATAVLDAFEAAGLSPCLYVDRDDADVVVGDTPATRAEHLAHIGPWLTRDDPWRVVLTEEVLAVGVVGCRAEPLEEVAVAVSDLAEAVVTGDLFYGDSMLVARPPGISKWQGVEAYCRHRGLDPARVLALGDGENDVELLTGARVACVVSDGCDRALALADHVIAPASDGGWSAVLDLV